MNLYQDKGDYWSAQPKTRVIIITDTNGDKHVYTAPKGINTQYDQGGGVLIIEQLTATRGDD